MRERERERAREDITLIWTFDVIPAAKPAAHLSVSKLMLPYLGFGFARFLALVAGVIKT